MNIIRQRQPNPQRYYSTLDDLIDGAEIERCPQCWERRPKRHMVEESDGVRRCPDCLVIQTEARKAEIEAHDAAMIGAKQTRPQVSIAPLTETEPAFIRVMEDSDGNDITQNNPMVLVRGGPAKTLTITGGDFASTDAFSYSSGISDSVAPSLSGTTGWTLTLAASGGASTGYKHMTFNNHTYRNLFIVS